MTKTTRLAAAAAVLLACSAASLAQTPMIPRNIIFGNPERASPQISPDGKRIAWVAPVKGVMNVWVAPAGKIQAGRPVTKDTGRGIRQFFWAFNNRHLLYLQDQGGNENDHVFRVDPATSEVTDLTPIAGVKATIAGVSHRKPGEILVGLNDRNKQLHDVWRVDLQSGKRQRVYQNNQFMATLADEDLRVRLGISFGADFKARVHRIDPDGKTTPIITLGSDDVLSTTPVGFTKDGSAAFVIDSRDRDKAALTRVNLTTLKTDVIYQGKKADVGGVLFHPTENTVQAIGENYDRMRWTAIDPTVKPDLDILARTGGGGDIQVVSKTLDDRTWIVAVTRDTDGVSWYRYDRPARRSSFLFAARPALKGYKLARMYPVIINTRDGLQLVSYLTLPPEHDRNAQTDKPIPMALWVHGGPWARDTWGYNSVHQWLANRGYAVLSVNYRGSTGFGKEFINKANREWAGKMHNDLIDAVDWAVANGIADPEKVAIAGGSYGGYSTLVGVTFTPEKFACGVDLVGPSSLVTLMKNVPPYWVPMLPVLKQRVGDPTTEEGRQFLLSRSPITRVKDIRKPLLIGQGANDPRVNQVEADQIAKAMKERGLPVTYLVYSDEGHGFARPENNLSFFAVMEGFLAKHLGGRYEPIDSAFRGSSIKVVEDGGDIPGLKEAAASK